MKRGNLLLISVILLLTLVFGAVSCNPLSVLRDIKPTDTETHPPTERVQRMTLTPFQPQTNTPTTSNRPVYTETSRPTSQPTITSTSNPPSTTTPTITPTALDKSTIPGIKGRWAAFNLDCEVRSAVDWAAYFGVQIDEISFFNALPRSDDPDLGFVGDVNAPWGSIPPEAYGVHAEPVAVLLKDYGLEALAVRDLSWDQLRAEISQGRPVIAWVVGRVGRGTPVPYTASSGRMTIVARFEHTVIVTGYSKTEVSVLDGYWAYTREIGDFLDSWEVLGNMAIIWDG